MDTTLAEVPQKIWDPLGRIHVLVRRSLLEIKVARRSKRTGLVKVVSVWNRHLADTFPITIDELVVVFLQEHGQNHLHLQFGDLHACASVPAAAPTKEFMGGIRYRVRSQPSTRVEFVRFGVELRVQVELSDGIHNEISSFDHLSANVDLFTEIPSEGHWS